MLLALDEVSIDLRGTGPMLCAYPKTKQNSIKLLQTILVDLAKLSQYVEFSVFE